MNEEMEQVQTGEPEDEITMDAADFGVEPEGEPSAEPDTGAAPQEEPEQPTEEPEQEEQTAEEPEEELFDLSDGQETRQVKRSEMLELAQKGQSLAALQQLHEMQTQQMADLRAFHDANEGHIADLTELAQSAGVSVEEFLTRLQESAWVNKGLNREAAKAEVQRQRAARQTAAKPVQEQRAQQGAAQERMNRELWEFAQAYPNVKAESVPKAVWDDVRKGVPLLHAYNKHRADQLEKQVADQNRKAATAAKNADNKAKAVGSVRSNGKPPVDEFLAGFNDGEW